MMEQREVKDGRGRTWVGSVTSGTARGGEEHAEVIFVCRDQPGELKRVGRLTVPPGEASAAWRTMRPDEVLDLLDRSEPA
jgi:hypothetical protein